MLVLTRRIGEEIVISGGIRITILEANRGRVRVGVEAPLSVSIDRLEVARRRQQEGWSSDPDQPRPHPAAAADAFFSVAGHPIAH